MGATMRRSWIAVSVIAWVSWTNDPRAAGPAAGQWRLYSAYTFRATCLVMGANLGGSRYFAVDARGEITRARKRDPEAINIKIETWCLPPGVLPE